jgi:hypothetical protein
MPGCLVERTVSPMTHNTQTKSNPNIDAIQRLYDGYGRRDVDAVVAELADDVDWAAEAAGTAVPWWGNYRGKGEVPQFFKEIATNVDISEFDVQSLTSNDTDVVATVHWTFTVRSTGKTASMYMQHWFRFADGKIAFFRGSEDTDQSARAFA